MDQPPKPPSYLASLAANSRKGTRELATWGKFVFSSLLAGIAGFIQFKEGMRKLPDVLVFLGIAVVSYPIVWGTVFIWNLVLAPRRIFREQWTKINAVESEVGLAQKATRLVELFVEIKEEIGRMNAIGAETSYDYQYQQAGLPTEELNRRFDARTKLRNEKLDASRHRQELRRTELGEKANSLAPIAAKKGVDWHPVIEFYATWKCNDDLIDTAETKARLLAAQFQNVG